VSNWQPIASPYRVDSDFRIDRAPTTPPDEPPSRAECETRLTAAVSRLDSLQKKLYADHHHAILLIFQAMDTAGKDGTIRAMLTGVNPAAVTVTSFGRPSVAELAHDFLWRGQCQVPELGHIGVFNRSWYEDVLVVRVHPELLDSQPKDADAMAKLWRHRHESIRDAEHNLARNGTLVLKFFLHVSHEEQRQRLLKRLDQPNANWKFQPADLTARAHWPAYMDAYQDALRATSRPWAPWYAIPADNKPFMRMTVAEIVVQAVAGLNLKWPEMAPDLQARLGEFRRDLEAGS
jgi:PPK2 family polyphosphate:nucleotide phosphotransferase